MKKEYHSTCTLAGRGDTTLRRNQIYYIVSFTDSLLFTQHHRGPSNSALHLGHLIPFQFTQYLQVWWCVPICLKWGGWMTRRQGLYEYYYYDLEKPTQPNQMVLLQLAPLLVEWTIIYTLFPLFNYLYAITGSLWCATRCPDDRWWKVPFQC